MVNPEKSPWLEQANVLDGEEQEKEWGGWEKCSFL